MARQKKNTRCESLFVAFAIVRAAICISKSFELPME
jgi:hypothetical protein